MIMKYIEKPNTLILAITPANTDFATSEAVKLARMVDPEGQRRVLKFFKIILVADIYFIRKFINGNFYPKIQSIFSSYFPIISESLAKNISYTFYLAGNVDYMYMLISL